ncbi:sugar phosphate isomerase/epimerase family protein [Mariniphaga sp.]|uniref:sugar phosphate isomerase/epimerase family protein n=1 Tax=Mariniphaga sp. TaxID=1954475 RepID=UPI003564523D
MNNRRTFIKTSLAATAGMIFTNPLLAMSAEGKSKLKKFGFISGIAGEAMKADWKGTLIKAVEFGFSELEGGTNFAASPQEFVSFCKEIGIKPIAGSVSFRSTNEELKNSFDKIKSFGQKYVIDYWPWYGEVPFDLEDCKKSVERLNEVGALAKNHGLKFLWHNHDNEFREMEKGMPFDYLMENTDPKFVNCEMDIYWVKKGGSDPLEMLKKYAGRIPILHVKDMAPDGDFICPGRGIIDFGPIFKEAKKQSIKHYFVERDNEPDGIGCLQSSAEYLKNLRF